MRADHAQQGEERGTGTSIWGLVFVVVGAWWLAAEMGFVAFDWGWVGPLAIIAVGAWMLLGRGCW